ncbi:MAG: serine/threonine protein phosphatase [Desulfovibrio sp.]|nr:serine/threonine protein phosphatase [Desulfovibrio sp.]
MRFLTFQHLLVRLPLLLLLLSFFLCGLETASFAAQSKRPAQETVYDNQAQTTEKELLAFLQILPNFRSWARSHHEEAHPSLTNGKPDFLYSQNAANWIKAQGWEPRRFFCVMGRMAAALVVVAEGNDLKGTRPADMPAVSDTETELAHRHLGRMLEAGGAVAPKVDITKPTLPKR